MFLPALVRNAGTPKARPVGQAPAAAPSPLPTVVTTACGTSIAFSGLTVSEAEQLLDWLENNGYSGADLSYTPDGGFTVFWAEWPDVLPRAEICPARETNRPLTTDDMQLHAWLAERVAHLSDERPGWRRAVRRVLARIPLVRGLVGS